MRHEQATISTRKLHFDVNGGYSLIKTMIFTYFSEFFVGSSKVDGDGARAGLLVATEVKDHLILLYQF